MQELLGYLAPATPGQQVRAVPGAGTDVPVWLLGSSTFSAQLAAHLGLPFAFASHFAPQEMMAALRLYRERFRPSQWRDRPHAMVGLPVIAADSDAKAKRLATTPAMKFLQLIRGEPFLMLPPVDSMEGLWTPQEQALVETKLAAAIVGGPKTVQRKMAEFLDETQADEVMINSDVYELSDRVRSLEIVADVMHKLAVGRPEMAMWE